MLPWLVAPVWAAPWSALRTQPLPTLPPAIYARAEAGELVTGTTPVSGGTLAWGVGLVDMPAEDLWRALTDGAHFEDWMSVDHSVVLQRPHRDRAVVFQYIDLPLGADRWWCVEQRHNAALYTQTGGAVWELSWQQRHGTPACEGLPDVSKHGTPVAQSVGSWLLVSVSAQQTRVEYASLVDPGGMLPSDQLARFAAGRIPQTFQQLTAMARWEQQRAAAGFVRPDGSPLP